MSRRPAHVSGSYGNDQGRTSMRTSPISRNGGHEYPFTSLIPAQVGGGSRRHGMTVQHMLNPSDEEPRRHSQHRSSQSSDTVSDRRMPSSSRGSGRGRPRVNRRVNHRTSRRGTRLSSESELSETERRAARPKYTTEEAHFIW